MTAKELKATLASSDAGERADALRQFADTDFGLEALPVLRRALGDRHVEVVIQAARCIAKLGPEAVSCPAGQAPVRVGEDEVDLVGQLVLAGSKVWGYSLYANCYSACLDALVTLEADEDTVVEYVHNHIGLTNPDDLLDSLSALKAVGTPDALGLFERAVAFWLPELNKTYTKKVRALAAAV